MKKENGKTEILRDRWNIFVRLECHETQYLHVILDQIENRREGDPRAWSMFFLIIVAGCYERFEFFNLSSFCLIRMLFNWCHEYLNFGWFFGKEYVNWICWVNWCVISSFCISKSHPPHSRKKKPGKKPGKKNSCLRMCLYGSWPQYIIEWWIFFILILHGCNDSLEDTSLLWTESRLIEG